MHLGEKILLTQAPTFRGDYHTTTFALPVTAAPGVDRDEEIQPVTMLQIGQQNDLMLVRACIVQDIMFANVGLGLKRLRDNPNGEYGIVAMSAFSNEPS